MEHDQAEPHLPTATIQREARERTVSAPAERRPYRQVLQVVALNLVVVTAAVVALIFTQRIFTEQSFQAANEESRFVTTEWALLQEIQRRTEQVLLEKDREIASLRELQAAIAERPELSDEAQRIRNALAQAYAERETILQARLSGSDEALAEAVRRIEEADGNQTAPGEGVMTGEEGTVLPVSEQIISPDDSATLAWFRQTVDQLRFGRAETAQLRLVTAGRESDVLRQSDYDRLLGLVTLIERQNTFLDTIAALERELDRRETEISRQDGRIRSVVAQLDGARQRIASLEQDVERLERRRLTVEEATALRAEMAEALEALAAERDRSSELERALAAARTQRLALGESLETVQEELDDARSQSKRTRGALAEAERAFEQLLVTKDEAVAEALESATQQTFEAAEILLDYLAGTNLSDAESTRTRILDFWEESQRYQELLTRARRLADAGVAPGRNDLPNARLVGVVTTLNDGSVLIESLTDVAVADGTAIEIRSAEGVQPGQLLATAEVDAVAGDLIQALLISSPGTPRERDLAYVMMMPESE